MSWNLIYFVLFFTSSAAIPLPGGGGCRLNSPWSMYIYLFKGNKNIERYGLFRLDKDQVLPDLIWYYLDLVRSGLVNLGFGGSVLIGIGLVTSCVAIPVRPDKVCSDRVLSEQIW